MSQPIIEAEGITKSFGDVQALTGVDLAVETGTVFGLLGPNGAGKTTMVRILTTLLKPDGGRARVAGFDVATQARELRSRIGLAGQYAAVDEILTGRENLEMVGRLYRLPTRVARDRADEILHRFDLAHAGDRTVKTYSGGMRRRLDLAASLVGRPEVLFLDEPTTGLDPRSRIGLWEFIERLVDEGTTLMLTTQYLEEADRLADRIAVIDNGGVLEEGTSDELKSKIGADVLELELSDPSQSGAALAALQDICCEGAGVEAEGSIVRVPVENAAATIREAIRRVDNAGISLVDIEIHRPTLDDVFLSITGHHVEEEPVPAANGSRRKRRGR
ncbi:MAG: ATP-binding cassette domain-containing protein [Acidimicrobiia bacterium]|nr:ATP-binding cassette domain-containing protein [Acidimicrobiia bacterium]